MPRSCICGNALPCDRGFRGWLPADVDRFGSEAGGWYDASARSRGNFPAPFYKRLVVVYQGIHPDVLIDYQSIGSGGGIQAITDKTVHFCGTDAPMNKKELEAVGGEEKHRRVSVVCGGRGADVQRAGCEGHAQVHWQVAG